MPEHSPSHFILLRGLTRESAHWGDCVPPLKAAFPHTKPSLLGQPGAGPYFHAIPRTGSPAFWDPLIADEWIKT